MNLPPQPPALLLAVAFAAAAPAQPLRDPMQPPPGFAAPAVAGPAAPRPAAAPEAAPLPAVRHLIVADGQRWVVDGGRRRGVGDRLGDARIERIEDTAVVVRQGGTLQRLPLFAGVVKQPKDTP
jgi:hypothetical protein